MFSVRHISGYACFKRTLNMLDTVFFKVLSTHVLKHYYTHIRARALTLTHSFPIATAVAVAAAAVAFVLLVYTNNLNFH